MLKKNLFILALLFSCRGFAQPVADSNVISIGRIDFYEKNAPHCSYFIAENEASNEKVFASPFKPLKSFKDRLDIPNNLVNKKIWLKFSVRNDSLRRQAVWFYPGSYFSKIDVFKQSGSATPTKISSDAATGFVHLSLQPKEEANYFVKLRMFKLKYNRISAIFIAGDRLPEYKNLLNDPYATRTNGLKLLSGMLLLMVMFTLVNFFLTKSPEFFYNFLYSFFMFLLLFFTAYLQRSGGWFRGFFAAWLDLFLLIAGTVSYLQFLINFIRTTIQNRFLDFLLRLEKLALVVMMLLYTALHFFTNTFTAQEIVENLMKIIILVTGIIFIIVALSRKNRLINYIVAGTTIQITCSVISLLLILSGRAQGGLFTSAGFYFAIGIMASVIFYLAALTYKNRADLVERISERAAMKAAMEKQEFEKKLELINMRQDERNRISADMHDDLGAGMTSIRLYSELALNKLGEQRIPELEKISNSANDLLNKMNAIIWSMNSSNDSFANMAAYIRTYTITYCEDNSIACSIALPDNFPEIEISGELRRNIFMVVKEALHNIVKHSGATKAELRLVLEGKKMIFTICDNGRGINLSLINQFGNGMKNMQKRMQSSGIDLQIENNDGVCIRLEKSF